MNDYIRNAEAFLSECVFEGLAHSYDVESKQYVKAYPEVTGYVLKYFCDYSNEIPYNIIEAADKLVDIQNKNGGYFSFDRSDILYSFDTAQIARGLCAIYKKTNEKTYYKAVVKCGEFLLESQELNGAFKPIFNCNYDAWIIRDETYSIWNGPYSGLMCKLTEALIDLYSVTNDERFLNAVNKAGNFYEKVEYMEYSHPLGYWLEGLWAAGKKNIVKKILEEKVMKRIQPTGYIAYTNSLDYAYVSGTIQLGILLFKCGYIEDAIKIRNYGRMVQACGNTGGLFQYADVNGNLNGSVHSEVNSWGTKYFCELERLLED